MSLPMVLRLAASWATVAVFQLFGDVLVGGLGGIWGPVFVFCWLLGIICWAAFGVVHELVAVGQAPAPAGLVERQRPEHDRVAAGHCGVHARLVGERLEPAADRPPVAAVEERLHVGQRRHRHAA